MPQITANNIEIEYDEFGKPSDPAVLLIMGLGTQMISWSEPFCQALAAGGFRVIRFDNRDVGLSQKMEGLKSPSKLAFAAAHLFGYKPTAPYSLEDMASDAIELLKALGIKKAHIVGASMGGMIAQLIAADLPDNSLSLTSIMSSSGRRGLPNARKNVVQRMLMQRPNGNSKEAYINHAVDTFLMIGSPGDRLKRSRDEWYALIESSHARSVYTQGFFRQMAAIAANGSRVQKLKSISIPSLVIHGQDDPLVPVEHGIDTAKHIPYARLKLIEGMGHDLPPNFVPELVDMLHEHFSLVN